MTHLRCAKFLIIASAAFLFIACDGDKKTDVPTDPGNTPPPTLEAEPSTEPGKEAAKTEEAAKEEETEEQVDPSAMETDPAATEGLGDIDYTGKLLEKDDQVGALYEGAKVQKSVSWTDKNGQQIFLIASAEQSKGGGMFRAIRATREGDGSWTTTREFKELVNECEFDLVMTPILDEKLSLTDLNKDGIGEVTFGWIADCTSDVSPNNYKILMSDGEEKYAIRGNTKVNPGNGEYLGGDQKVDPSFEKAPAGFLDHAKKVWDAHVLVSF